MVTSTKEYMALTPTAKLQEDPAHVLELMHNEESDRLADLVEESRQRDEDFAEKSTGWTEAEKLEYLTGEIK